MLSTRLIGPTLATLLAVAGASVAAGELTRGTPDLRTAGPLAFGPDGILFIGDPVQGAVYAVDTGDRVSEPIGPGFYRSDIDQQVNALLDEGARLFRFNDLAVNPASGKAYLSFDVGKVRESTPYIVRVDRAGKVEVVTLRDVRFAKVTLRSPFANQFLRPGPNFEGLSVTEMAFVGGRLYVAGLSGEPVASRIVTIPYPFPAVADPGTSVEVFHSGLGESSTTLPIFCLAPCELKGEPCFLAVYTQTPLVKIPIAALKPGASVRATTLADLGNRNAPHDMLAYRAGGKEFLLVTNTRQGMMKIGRDWLEDAPAIETRLVGPAGLVYESIPKLRGISLMDRVDDGHALVVGNKSRGFDLFVLPLP